MRLGQQAQGFAVKTDLPRPALRVAPHSLEVLSRRGGLPLGQGQAAAQERAVRLLHVLAAGLGLVVVIAILWLTGGLDGMASVRKMKRSDGVPKPAMLPL